MKNKAIILTFHCVENYGAVFQCQALEEKLKKYFNKVEVTDYCPEYLTKDYKLINTHSMKSVIMSLYSLPSFLKKKIGFKKYKNKHLNISSKRYYDSSKMTDIDADFVFVGSDQIWNSGITNGYDPVFFGDIPSCKDAKVVSYAASLGNCTLSGDEKEEFFENIKHIDCISVREDEAMELLTEHGEDATLVIDPTMLVDESYWEKIAPKKNGTDDYVLIYNLTGAPELTQMANVISKATDMKIVEIYGKRKKLRRTNHKVMYSASPKRFLELISNATYVVTDSFHGTAFSIIFRKNFYVVPHKTRGGRMKTLLFNLGIENRIRTEINEGFANEDIDYKKVEEKLFDMRRNAVDFIEKSIER